MNKSKEINREHARKVLNIANIKWESFNNDNHWKIGSIDFWPTTLKWIDNYKNEKGNGVSQLVEHLRITYPMQIYVPKGVFTLQGVQPLSVEQLFQIAAHSKDKSLMGICESIHKEIYK